MNESGVGDVKTSFTIRYSTSSRSWGKSLGTIINKFIWLRLGQKFSWLLHYFAYISTFPWLFKIWAITVLSVIHCHSFESFWRVLLKYQKILSSLQFILCWRRRIFLMIIQIFTEKYISSNFWTADPLSMVDFSFFSFWEIYILITHWWPINIP